MSVDGSLLDQIHDLERRLYELRKQVAGAVTSEPLPVSGVLSYLVCGVDGERMALLLEAVDEVVAVPLLAALPESPPWIAGLLNLRGETLPVLDVSARLRRRAREIRLSDLVVVCRWRSRRVGILVQEILDVRECDASRVQSPGDVPHGPYLTGVLPEDRPVLFLSLEQLLARSEIPEEEG